MKNNIDQFCPSNPEDWRKWLSQHHEHEKGVWLVIYKKSSKTPNLSWSQAVDEALCYGWIDSVKQTIDNEKYRQYFTKRKPKSTWSKVNKEKVEQLIKNGKMTKAGADAIEIAKQNGYWTLLDSVEQLIIPNDLQQQLDKHPDAKSYFLSLNKATQKGMLFWIKVAKRSETRTKRINEIIEKALVGQKPKQFV